MDNDKVTATVGLNIHKDFPCDGRNYQRGRTGAVKYIVIHYVGALGSAKENCVYYGRTKVGASAHFYVGHAPGAEIWQSVGEEDAAWHCGTAKGYRHPECRNANSIGIELCCRQDKAGTWCFDPETVDRAVELARWLMAKYGIGVDHVVRHYDVTGKVCPAPFVLEESAWESFKKRLEEKTLTEEEVRALVAEEVTRALAERDEIGARVAGKVSVWAARSWEKAQRVKVLDGTRPGGALTREQYAVTLDRLGLLDGGV